MVDGVIVTIIKAFVLVNVLMAFFALMTWVERKLIGRFQVRYGPNRVGPYGLLQPIADLGKMLQKESVVPDGARRKLYMVAPLIAMTCALGAFGLIPFGNVATIPGTDFTIPRTRTGLMSSLSPAISMVPPKRRVPPIGVIATRASSSPSSSSVRDIAPIVAAPRWRRKVRVSSLLGMPSRRRPPR